MSDDPKLLRAEADYYHGEWQKAVAENEKLRAEIDKLRDEYIAFMGQQIDKGRYAAAAALKETE